jgi:hypothetical protein
MVAPPYDSPAWRARAEYEGHELPHRLLPPSYLHPLLLNPLVSPILRIHLLLSYLHTCQGPTTSCERKLLL